MISWFKRKASNPFLATFPIRSFIRFLVSCFSVSPDQFEIVFGQVDKSSYVFGDTLFLRSHRRFSGTNLVDAENDQDQ